MSAWEWTVCQRRTPHGEGCVYEYYGEWHWYLLNANGARLDGGSSRSLVGALRAADRVLDSDAPESAERVPVALTSAGEHTPVSVSGRRGDGTPYPIVLQVGSETVGLTPEGARDLIRRLVEVL